jgi:hypothetical protein
MAAWSDTDVTTRTAPIADVRAALRGTDSCRP